MARILKEHEKQEIKDKSFLMEGNRNKISEKLSKEYKVTTNTIKKYLHPKFNELRANRLLKSDERQSIIDAYNTHPSESHYEKIKSLALKFGRSQATIRNVVPKPTKIGDTDELTSKPIKDKVKYFDYKQFQF